MAYNSIIDIKLPQIADMEDEKLVPYIQRIHNACHILNSAVDPAIRYLSTPEFGNPLDESVTFANRMIWVPSAPDLEIGRVVEPKRKERQWNYGVTRVTASFGGGTFFISLPFAITIDGPRIDDDGQHHMLVGFPPVIFEVEDMKKGNIGDTLYANKQGEIAIPEDVNSDWTPVGRVISVGYVLLSFGVGGRN